MLLLALLACKHPDPAPADLDGLMHFAWQKYDDGLDEELADAVVHLDAAIADASVDALGSADGYLTDWFTLTVSDLTKEEQALVLPDDERDPAGARGFVVVNPLPCTVDQVERFVYEADQKALYPDAYDAYSREYTSSLEDYQARATHTLTWHTDLVATTSGFTYRELLDGGIRHVPAIDDARSPFGAFVVNRTWLTEPACFFDPAHPEDGCASDDPDSSAHFTQDYQLEIQYERAGGTVVHMYVIWREAEYFGIDQESDWLMGEQMKGLVDWDDDTAALCAAEDAG